MKRRLFLSSLTLAAATTVPPLRAATLTWRRVRARDAADVAADIDFARANQLRLVVKGGGNSYLGTSNAPDSLLIWTRALNQVTLHDAFVHHGVDSEDWSADGFTRLALVPAPQP